MKYRTFNSIDALENAAVDLLIEHFTLDADGPHAVMLTGGDTPMGIYRRLARSKVRADGNLYVLESDERHVPLHSDANNYAKMRPAVEALGVDAGRTIRVHTELQLSDAAERYDRRLAAFFAAGGRITLGILGLGADGHAASLFTPENVNEGKGRLAIAVYRDEGPDRVSVTSDLLQRVERLVFLVAGERKKAIVRDFLDRRGNVVALMALDGRQDYELWQA